MGSEALDLACNAGLDVTAHHCFTTAVHAVHMHTGHLMLMHGQSDQRVWDLGAGPPGGEFTWNPNPAGTTWAEVVRDPAGQPVLDENGEVVLDSTFGIGDMFCTGHVPLADGRILFGGGNVTGGGAGGGLHDLNIFDPSSMQPALVGTPMGSFETCPFGWAVEQPNEGVFWQSQIPRMQDDRWYPTLTELADGRVLISSGYTRNALDGNGNATRSRLLEVYDPETNTIEQLGDALFPHSTFPDYPFMFLLPNGDVLYAGSETASDPAQARGRILIPDYNNDNGVWDWDGHTIDSSISGGSAAMFTPGVVVKTGGPVLNGDGEATAITEVVDLRGFASGDYGGAPERFTSSADPTSGVSSMGFPRHFHNLVLLPDGKVLAVGGNTYSNSDTDQQGVESWTYPCAWEGVDGRLIRHGGWTSLLRVA